jgi:hypothetical protein
MKAPDENGMFDCPDCDRKSKRLFRVNEKGIEGYFVCRECQELFYPDFAPGKEVLKITNIIARE